MRLRLALMALALLVRPWCASSAADLPERILDFHSDITLGEDGTLLVRETISVNSRGSLIRHGIHRDFPTRYQDRLGNHYVVGFELLSAERDGTPEISRVEDQLNGKRIYLGNANSLLPAGRHTYVIAYTTNRQLGFFSDHDEMYWNVTGNGWVFPIDHASATVTLPGGISGSPVSLDGFTGPQHSFARNLTHQQQPEGSYYFETTSRLGSHEGLSIVLSWRKGLIAPPAAEQQVKYFFSDNRVALITCLCFLLLLLYYLLVWYAVGRDPVRGVVMPLYEPPANLSPAAMRYLVRMGFDNKTFAAAILDMAVRGYLTIKEQAGSYTLYRTQSNLLVLTPDERQIAGLLFDGRDQLWLHNQNYKLIQQAIAALKSWLKLAEEKVYFLTNSRYLLPGVVFSIVAVLGLGFLESVPSLLATVFLCFWLSIWSLACVGLIIGCAAAWKAALSSPAAALTGKAALISLFALPFLAGECLGVFFLAKLSSIFVAGLLFSSVLLHVLFHFLLKAPTLRGRRLMDQVDGFKMFLGEVDGDRLNRIMPPDHTPRTFERFLPFALALDVEQAWSGKFASQLGSAGHAPGGQAYTPSFYSGTNANGFGPAGFLSSFSGGFTSAISSSSSAPGSSSGAGGGSGGGGGGGGGGGW